MAWITVTETDVLTVMSGPELASIRRAALGAGQPDPVPATIAQVVDQVRGAVGACERNQLGAGETIPQKLRATALDILAYRIPSRVGLTPATTRETLYKDAVALLKEVAACRFDIEEPVTPTDEKSSGLPLPSLNPRRRRFGWDQQNGL